MTMATAVTQGVIFLDILGSRGRTTCWRPQGGRGERKVAIKGHFLVMQPLLEERGQVKTLLQPQGICESSVSCLGLLRRQKPPGLPAAEQRWELCTVTCSTESLLMFLNVSMFLNVPKSSPEDYFSDQILTRLLRIF